MGHDTGTSCSTMTTPIGPILISAYDAGISGILFEGSGHRQDCRQSCKTSALSNSFAGHALNSPRTSMEPFGPFPFRVFLREPAFRRASGMHCAASRSVRSSRTERSRTSSVTEMPSVPSVQQMDRTPCPLLFHAIAWSVQTDRLQDLVAGWNENNGSSSMKERRLVVSCREKRVRCAFAGRSGRPYTSLARVADHYLTR